MGEAGGGVVCAYSCAYVKAVMHSIPSVFPQHHDIQEDRCLLICVLS
jgi:hypothetical protein